MCREGGRGFTVLGDVARRRPYLKEGTYFELKEGAKTSGKGIVYRKEIEPGDEFSRAAAHHASLRAGAKIGSSWQP